MHHPIVFLPTAGAAPGDLGEAVEPTTLAELRIPEPSVEQGKIACEALDLNRFRNFPAQRLAQPRAGPSGQPPCGPKE
jgi:hypothetical protein